MADNFSISPEFSQPVQAENPAPASTSNGTASLKDSILASEVTAQSAMDTVNNHPTTQSVKDTISNGENTPLPVLPIAHTDITKGPVGQNVKEQSAKTASEFSDLADARKTPDQPAATGQPLTHYHSLFYRLLSWKNPRATAISYATVVVFIFASRYLNILRYIFKALYVVLGLTATAEAAGQLAFGSGFTSQIRPRKYFVIPKASLERFLDDAEQLINFFVIEFQRIVFAENLLVTAAAFFSALISYWLIKFTPVWGLSLISTTVLYFGPLVYLQNKEFIDAQLENGRQVVGQQATQLRDLAAQQTGRASETIRSYAGEYSAKAQDTINQARGRAPSPNTAVKKEDFPIAPKQEPAIQVHDTAILQPKDEPVAQAI